MKKFFYRYCFSIVVGTRGKAQGRNMIGHHHKNRYFRPYYLKARKNLRTLSSYLYPDHFCGLLLGSPFMLLRRTLQQASCSRGHYLGGRIQLFVSTVAP
jgi:hypothetical protein